MKNNKKSQIYFYKGKINCLEKIKEKEEENNKYIQNEFLKIIDTQNLSFLFGAGCSSYKENQDELGIPTMKDLAKCFYKTLKNDNDEIKNIFEKLNLDNIEEIKENLEKLMEILFAHSFISKIQNEPNEVNKLIKFIENFIFDKCNIESEKVKELYKKFYRKILMRDSNLPKVNIFTTNYDLFNESALDELGIIYCNGFSGMIERFFNPSIFSYAFAEQMDLNYNKWNIIDNFIYLYKLHGSISWIEDKENKHLFKIKEIQKPCKDSDNSIMIYPTPTKQNSSFGSPYSDIFREFQKKLMRANNILIVIGYSFGDEHINNIIYQALTIPTFRLIIIGDKDVNDNTKRLFNLEDNRIWFIYGNNNKQNIHYFNNFVEFILPDSKQDRIEIQLEKVKEFFI